MKNVIELTKESDQFADGVEAMLEKVTAAAQHLQWFDGYRRRGLGQLPVLRRGDKAELLLCVVSKMSDNLVKRMEHVVKQSSKRDTLLEQREQLMGDLRSGDEFLNTVLENDDVFELNSQAYFGWDQE